MENNQVGRPARKLTRKAKIAYHSLPEASKNLEVIGNKQLEDTTTQLQKHEIGRNAPKNITAKSGFRGFEILSF